MPNEIIVSVCCLTYNHENFIRDAIEGFLEQMTDFPIEILIHDDASTDGTTGIVREYQGQYPDLIKVVYQTENQYSQGKIVIDNLFNIAKGKYIALCEGDDYWTDPLKLQKQVDFMESHPECSLCFHKVLRVFEDKTNNAKDYEFPDLDHDQILTKEQFFGNTYIQTCSALFRNIDIRKLMEFSKKFEVGDTPLFYFYAYRGDLGFLNENMAVYRIHPGGIWTARSTLDNLMGVYETHSKIKRLLKIKNNHKLDSLILGYIFKIIEYYHQYNDYKQMRKFILKCLLFLPIATDKQKFTLKRRAFKAFLPKLYHRLQ